MKSAASLSPVWIASWRIEEGKAGRTGAFTLLPCHALIATVQCNDLCASGKDLMAKGFTRKVWSRKLSHCWKKEQESNSVRLPDPDFIKKYSKALVQGIKWNCEHETVSYLNIIIKLHAFIFKALTWSFGGVHLIIKSLYFFLCIKRNCTGMLFFFFKKMLPHIDMVSVEV